MATKALWYIIWTILTTAGTPIPSIKRWNIWGNAGFAWTSKIKRNPPIVPRVRTQPMSMLCLLKWVLKCPKCPHSLLAWLLMSRTRIIVWNDWCHSKWHTNLTLTKCSVAVRDILRLQTATTAHLFVDNSIHLREGETSDMSGTPLEFLLCVLWELSGLVLVLQMFQL